MRASMMTWLSILALAAVAPGLARADYSESVNGDLSGNRNAPTLIPVALGSNVVTATSIAGDLEYFRIVVPAGQRLSALNLNSFGSGNLSFIAIQSGTVFTEPPTGTNPANLLGYAHFGASLVGTDILDNMGSQTGTIGFIPPLPAGSYVFWSQETSASTPSNYALNLVITSTAPPVPALPSTHLPVLALLFALVGFFALRGRRSSRI